MNLVYSGAVGYVRNDWERKAYQQDVCKEETEESTSLGICNDF